MSKIVAPIAVIRLHRRFLVRCGDPFPGQGFSPITLNRSWLNRGDLRRSAQWLVERLTQSGLQWAGGPTRWGTQLNGNICWGRVGDRPC